MPALFFVLAHLCVVYTVQHSMCVCMCVRTNSETVNQKGREWRRRKAGKRLAAKVAP